MPFESFQTGKQLFLRRQENLLQGKSTERGVFRQARNYTRDNDLILASYADHAPIERPMVRLAKQNPVTGVVCPLQRPRHYVGCVGLRPTFWVQQTRPTKCTPVLINFMDAALKRPASRNPSRATFRVASFGIEHTEGIVLSLRDFRLCIFYFALENRWLIGE